MTKRTKKPKKLDPSSASQKQEKLFQNLLRTVQQFLSGKAYQPLTVDQLMERLSMPVQHDQLLHAILQQFIKQGIVECSHGKYIWKQKHDDVVVGLLSVHPRGFGFLRPEDPSLYSQDIFIPKHLTLSAVDGDKVEVIVNTEVHSEKGPEGRVTAILSRGRTHIAGIISAIESWGDIIAYVPLLGSTQRVVVESSPEFRLKVGDRVVMEVLDWGSKSSDTACRVASYIGHIDDSSCDVAAAIEEFELQSDFSQRTIKEAQSFGTRVSKKEIDSREDLRDLESFTIDPNTAKDFDDAINVFKDEKGHYHLGVHIADVSHYVATGSALDQEAKQRCNSTYFPGYCLPMLPHELSSHLCSLKPNVNRLTISTLMEFDPTGHLVSHRITRSVIKSRKRFTYREAKKVLDGKQKSAHIKALKLMVELCHLLKVKRHERGSVEFAIPDLCVLVDEKGMPSGLDCVEYDITHQLVEEFMLKANEVVATHLTEMGKGLTYRIHEEPSGENMRDFVQLVATFGYELSDPPTQKELQLLFNEALKTSYGQYLATSYIKRMRLAIYSPNNIGHYGLGLTHYCHFTSPIRRYADLVVHRILMGQEDDKEMLESISLRCSEQERVSAKAENNVLVLKKLRLLKCWKDKEPGRQYSAIVTRVRAFGIFFEVLDLMLESFLHISELDNDYFVHNEFKQQLEGRHTGKAYKSGDKMTVMLKNVNFINLESEWALVSSKSNPYRAKSKQKRKR
jgi:ribonuclease R